MSLSFRRVLAAVIVASVASVASAQTGTSTITVVVRDSSGALIPGATVNVINESTGASVEAVTNGQGSYRAAGLVPGNYRLETVLDGFETAVNRIGLEAGQTAASNVTLSLGVCAAERQQVADRLA